MSAARREKLTLSLPPDPALAGLTQMVTVHFLRQNGVAPHVARRSARTVKARAQVLLKAGARDAGRGRRALDLVLTCGGRTLEAVLRSGAAAGPRPLVRLERPASA